MRGIMMDILNIQIWVFVLIHLAFVVDATGL